MNPRRYRLINKQKVCMSCKSCTDLLNTPASSELAPVDNLRSGEDGVTRAHHMDLVRRPRRAPVRPRIQQTQVAVLPVSDNPPFRTTQRIPSTLCV
jgi:hypothetical protein